MTSQRTCEHAMVSQTSLVPHHSRPLNHQCVRMVMACSGIWNRPRGCKYWTRRVRGNQVHLPWWHRKLNHTRGRHYDRQTAARTSATKMAASQEIIILVVGNEMLQESRPGDSALFCFVLLLFAFLLSRCLHFLHSLDQNSELRTLPHRWNLDSRRSPRQKTTVAALAVHATNAPCVAADQ